MIDNPSTIDLPESIVTFIKKCIQKEHSESYLISVLHKIQETFGWISERHMNKVSELMQIPTSVISGVVTFYHFFRLKPRGKFAISVCMGTACFVKGAEDVLNSFKTELGITVGETTPDGLFSLETSRCIGVCALAPVVTINDAIYSQVDHKQIPELLRLTLNSETIKVK